jgi:hypothetical protein
MKSLVLLLSPLLAALVSLTCGGGASNDDLLHLRSYDISPNDFRDYVRELLLTPTGRSTCEGIRGLDTEEVVDVLKSDDPTKDALLPEGGIRRSGQTAAPEDSLTAAKILQEECKRVDM